MRKTLNLAVIVGAAVCQGCGAMEEIQKLKAVVQVAEALERGDGSAAFDTLAGLTEVSDEDPDSYIDRAILYELAGDLDKALADYTKTIELSKQSDAAELSFVYFQRGFVCHRKGSLKQALDDYRQAFDRDADLFVAALMRARILCTSPDEELRNGDEALETAIKLCEMSDWTDYEALDTLAAAYAEQGDFEQAIEWAEKAATAAVKEQDDEFKRECEDRLALYRDGTPYREAAYGRNPFDQILRGE